MALPNLVQSTPGEIQYALGRAVIECVCGVRSWRSFADELRNQASRKPHPDDTASLVEFVAGLTKGHRRRVRTSAKGLDRLLYLLVGGPLKLDVHVNAWRPRPGAGEGQLKQEAIEPFVRRHLEELTDLEVVAPPWKKPGEPRKRCVIHGGDQILNCSCCWKESKKWASVYVFGDGKYDKDNNFDLVARSRQRSDDGRTQATDVLVVEVKLVKGRLTRPDPRFIGQLLLARSRHDRVVGICSMCSVALGQSVQASAAALGLTRQVLDCVGVKCVVLDLH